MPYRDPEKQREYQREYQRSKRSGSRIAPGRVDLPPSFRLSTAQDLIGLLEEQIDAVRRDTALGTLERARCVGALINVGLRALEQRDLTTRIEALEAVLKRPGRPGVRAA
jgi:hypothetical protein